MCRTILCFYYVDVKYFSSYTCLLYIVHTRNHETAKQQQETTNSVQKSLKNTDEYYRRSERIAKLRIKANTTAPSGNAIVDLKSTDATVGEAYASNSSGGM